VGVRRSSGELPVGSEGSAAVRDAARQEAVGRAVRVAGVVVYVYAGLALATALIFVVGAVAAYREGTSPCRPDEEPCESLGVVVAFMLVGMAAIASVASALSALLAGWLRRESRVAVWLTLVLGGVAVACLMLTGLTAVAADRPGVGGLAIGLAAAIALPVGLVVRAAVTRSPSAVA
jgi:hypothetical protein